jgi:hypothetical protein
MQSIRFRGRCFIGLSSLVAVIAVAGYGLAGEITFPADKLMSHVRFLAGEELRGRKAGSSDERRAAEYIADQLDAAGVVAPPGTGRYQDFRVSAKRAESERHSTNVLGWIEGAEPILRDQMIVVGAHLDHLGVRRGATYPGADDNASGVAAILEIAAALQARREPLGRSVLVAFFGSEEIGLVGSKQFVRDCPIPLDRIVAMVNVDMIGRELLDRASFKSLKRLIRIDAANSVGVLGAGTRPLFAQVVDSACQQVGLTAYGTQNIPFLSTLIDNLAKNRSDHAPFENVGIPTIFFSSGESDDYHRPSDTVATIDAPLMARRAQAIYATVVALSNAASNKLPPIQNARPPAGQRVETLTLTHGRLGVDLQDNSDSPNRLSGLQSLFHTQNTPRFDAFDPDAPGASAGLNFEHIISGHRNQRNRFTPRHGAYPLYRLADQRSAILVRRREDSPWDVSSTMRYRLVEPNTVDFRFRCTPHDAARFGTRRYAIFFFANYMNDVFSPAVHFWGIDAPGGKEKWIEATVPPGHADWDHGGTYRAVDAAPTAYDDDHNFKLNSWTYDFPRFTLPFYYGRAAHDMVFLLMFDRACMAEDEIRISVFKFKLPEKPRPAWDFQYVIRRVQKDREYGFRGRLMWKKWVSAEDCLDQYQRWTRELATSQSVDDTTLEGALE